MSEGKIMYLNKEIEFKSFISEAKYNELLEKFGLDNNVFAQTNHYFDTPDTKLLQEKTVLRIRQKGNNFKITKKTRAEVGANETHILISKEKALEYLKNGFDGSIIGVPYYVNKIAELTTYRVSTPYKNFWYCCGFIRMVFYSLIRVNIMERLIMKLNMRLMTIKLDIMIS